MVRLTNHDDQGNWSLKGVKWENLYEGAVIDKKTYERLYTALWSLKDYEDTGLDPDRIEELKERDTVEMAIITGDNHAIGCKVGTCPKCDAILMSYMRFCYECGQRLDWEEL